MGEVNRRVAHDGPAYRDLENPNAALFHIRVEDMDRAMGWFQSDTFKDASRRAKVTGRTFYEAHPRSGIAHSPQPVGPIQFVNSMFSVPAWGVVWRPARPLSIVATWSVSSDLLDPPARQRAACQ